MKTVIIVVVVLVVVAVVAILALRAMRTRDDQRRHRADQLRSKAAAQSGTVDVARAEADRAEQQAAEARLAADVEEARQEDSLRAADTLDPDVDHRADGYRPGAAGGRETGPVS